MNAAGSCAGGCRCRAVSRGPASAKAALRVALPPAAALLASGGLGGGGAATGRRLKLARWPLQLGAARVVLDGTFFRPDAASGSGFQSRRRGGLVVVNKGVPLLQGSNWLNGQGSSLWKLQLGLLAANSIKPCHCQSKLAAASISQALLSTSA